MLVTMLGIRNRYGGGMIDPDPDPGTGGGAGIAGIQALDPQQLGAYFVLTEAVSLLQYQVEQQLRAEGDLTYVQFQLLARLADAHGSLTMTQLAPTVVYSRSELPHHAAPLHNADPTPPHPIPAP